MIDITSNRLRFRAQLRPALGTRFQPTGFPDLGAAEYTGYRDGEPVRTLLVESPQSMANRLENTAWDIAAQAPVGLVRDLPYIEVRKAEEPHPFVTTSRQEAHRLASPYVRSSLLGGRAMTQVIAERFGLANDQPLDYPAIARAVFALDPFTLLHGCFFNQKEWPGQPKFARAASAAIEAYDVEQAVSGGRKSDHVRHHTGKDADPEEGTALAGSSEGYGSIPFQRVEYTARLIEAQFSVDVQLLRTYALGSEQTELLAALALWEIRTFLDGGLRLRTACDLELTEVVASSVPLPETETLEARIRELISAVTPDLDHTGPLTVLWDGGKTTKRAKSSKKPPAQKTRELTEAAAQ
ncbi:type I-U CRISPR-associated RAMP protein Csb1/Cas7u [Streptomyces sp. MS19]|uniref:type I-G CRISPR-associated RAMP protein Csb1/Cas7g n=1 Tax=Streptomyces sp. MS19 TaxID=3385972 RepID=UPI0039A22739